MSVGDVKNILNDYRVKGDEIVKMNPVSKALYRISGHDVKEVAEKIVGLMREGKLKNFKTNIDSEIKSKLKKLKNRQLKVSKSTWWNLPIIKFFKKRKLDQIKEDIKFYENERDLLEGEFPDLTKAKQQSSVTKAKQEPSVTKAKQQSSVTKVLDKRGSTKEQPLHHPTRDRVRKGPKRRRPTKYQS